MHLMIYFQLNDLEIRKGYNLNSKRLKLGMVSSFDQHNMCAKVERVTTKTGCTSSTNWTISFKVRGFPTKTHLLQRHFFFQTYFNSRLFVHSICTIQSHILKFQLFLTSLSSFHA